MIRIPFIFIYFYFSSRVPSPRRRDLDSLTTPTDPLYTGTPVVVRTRPTRGLKRTPLPSPVGTFFEETVLTLPSLSF